MIRTLGVGSWWDDAIDRRHSQTVQLPAFKLAYGTRGEWRNGGWLVVAIPKKKRRKR